MKTKLIHLKYFIHIVTGLMLSTALPSCKKFVDVPPPTTGLAGENVYATDATAAAVLTGIYTGLNGGSPGTGDGSISLRAGLSADEFTYYPTSTNTRFDQLYRNSIIVLDFDAVIWEQSYKLINVANTALEGLNAATGISPAVKQQLTGEAFFARALMHFYLVNLFGDVPLVTTSDYRINNSISRSPKQVVYDQIIADLKGAQSLLSTNYRAGNITSETTERVRPNQAVATALLARVYLYLGHWASAEAESTKLISNTGTYTLTNLNDVFLTESTEAIWQLAEVDKNLNTLDGQLFILNSKPNSSHPVSLSPMLLESFEPSDKRRDSWVGSRTVSGVTYYYPYKYKISSGTPIVERLTVFRLAEQYLIRAEARAELNRLPEARADLNAIRERAGLLPTSEDNQQALLELIYHERQIELFSEWGHRWLDLKRTGKVDAVMTTATTLKGGTWKTTAQLYPIPQSDINRNPKLIQNQGY